MPWVMEGSNCEDGYVPHYPDADGEEGLVVCLPCDPEPTCEECDGPKYEWNGSAWNQIDACDCDDPGETATEPDGDGDFVGDVRCGTCEAGSVNTGCCDVPSGLSANFSAPDCPALHGISLDLTYDGLSGGVHTWSATFSPGGSCGELTLKFAAFDGVSCEVAITIETSTGSVIFGDVGGTGTTACPFTSSDYTAPIPACMSAIECVGNLTVLVA